MSQVRSANESLTASLYHTIEYAGQSCLLSAVRKGGSQITALFD